MSATCRRHVGNMVKCCLFSSRQGKFGDMVSCVSATFVSRFSNIDVPRTDEIRLSLLLIPTSSVDLNNRSPQQKAQSVASSPLATSSPHAAPALFVCSSVHLFLWLVVTLSLCPLSSRPVPSCRRAKLLRYVSSLVVHLVVVESLLIVSRLPASLYCAP
jgi:hypothetical protein